MDAAGVAQLTEAPGHEEVPQGELLRWPFVSTGNARIDALFQGSGTSLIRGDTDQAAVELVQDLLRGHDRRVSGRKSWATPLAGETFGVFAARTERAIIRFKQTHWLTYGFPTPFTGVVDSRTIRALAIEKATTPSPGAIYVAVVLEQPVSIWTQMVTMISTYEEDARQGGFAAQSPPGMDSAGLSYGVLQWTHRSGRLSTLLQRFRTQAPMTFGREFSVPPTTTDGLLEHAADPAGRLNADGSTHSNFLAYDLFSTRWRKRFQAAGLNRTLQRQQLLQAVADVRADCAFVMTYADRLQSQWAIGFWLDLTNQLGRTGARTRYLGVVNDLGGTPTEQQILDKVVADSSFPDRRKYFRDRAPLSKVDGFPTP